MASKNYHVHTRIVRTEPRPAFDPASLSEEWRRSCGCIRTSDKLKEILKSFPSPPPPSPVYHNTCISTHCQNAHEPPAKPVEPLTHPSTVSMDPSKPSKSWRLVFELVQLVQLSVTATALALYYLIYCYMQLVYYTLRSALYFHQADGPMKITIAVVTVTSLVVGFNLVIRIEKLIGLFN